MTDEDGRGRTRTDRMAYSRQLDYVAMMVILVKLAAVNQPRSILDNICTGSVSNWAHGTSIFNIFENSLIIS